MTLVVPTISLDVSLLDRMAASVDYPVSHKVVINGGRTDALDEWQHFHLDWKIYNFGRNLGFGGSCNAATKLFPYEESWLLLNDDGELQPGCLERMSKASDEHAKNCHIIYVNENQAFDICVWTAKGVRDFGLFDENLWPAYFEDTDLHFRFSLDPSFKAHYIEAPFPVKHGKPRACGPKYMAMMEALKPLNEDYMLRKWGSLSDKPALKTPFNNPNNKLYDWVLEHVSRERREVICKRFWSQGKPSLYE
jgi:hypothetical protein